jgi:hypothetical protein
MQAPFTVFFFLVNMLQPGRAPRALLSTESEHLPVKLLSTPPVEKLKKEVCDLHYW